MKFLRKRNLFSMNVLGVLAAALVSVPAVAEERDQSREQLMDTWGQSLQEKVSVQLEQTMNAEIVLQYENLLAQQTSELMDQVALAVTIESEPVIFLEPDSMMANVVPAGIEIDCDR